MTITISIPKEHNGMYARVAGSIVQILQEFNSEENAQISLIYKNHPKVDALSIINWLEFSVHEKKTFKLESDLTTLKEVEREIKQLFNDFVV